MSRENARTMLAAATLFLVAVAAAAPSLAGEDEKMGWKMTTYLVGFIYKGPTWTGEPSARLDEMQKGHLANNERMAEAGNLILAGPFTDGGDLRGLWVFKFDGMSPDEMIAAAEKLLADDPMMKAGHLRVEFHPWYSAEGIGIDQGR